MILTRIAKLEKALESGLTVTTGNDVDDEKRDRLFIELNNLEASLNDRLEGLSNKLSGFQEEIERLADHISEINAEAISKAAKVSAAVPTIEDDELEILDDAISAKTIASVKEQFGFSSFIEGIFSIEP